MRLRISEWGPLLDASNLHHGRLRPILMHCCDDQGRPLLAPQPRKDGEPGDLSNAHLGISLLLRAEQNLSPVSL